MLIEIVHIEARGDFRRVDDMHFIKKLFGPREIRAMLGVLDEAEHRFDTEAFRVVRGLIEQAILNNPGAATVKARIEEGVSPRQLVYVMIANLTGDMVESGQFHVWRGVLNPMGMGNDLLRLFDAATDELVAIGAETPERAASQKAAIRRNIDEVG